MLIHLLLLSLSVYAHQETGGRSFNPVLKHRFFEVIESSDSTTSNSQLPFTLKRYFPAYSNPTPSNRNTADLIAKASDLAISFASRKLSIATSAFVVTNAYETPHLGLVHVYLQQVVKGALVANGFANVNVDTSSDSIVSFGSSFHQKVCALCL
jgi:hypothetical protein